MTTFGPDTDPVPLVSDRTFVGWKQPRHIVSYLSGLSILYKVLSEVPSMYMLIGCCLYSVPLTLPFAWRDPSEVHTAEVHVKEANDIKNARTMTSNNCFCVILPSSSLST